VWFHFYLTLVKSVGPTSISSQETIFIFSSSLEYGDGRPDMFFLSRVALIKFMCRSVCKKRHLVGVVVFVQSPVYTCLNKMVGCVLF
jgi:hypothetical protein